MNSLIVSLFLSLSSLAIFAWFTARSVRRHVHPDRRRDLTLANADRPQDLEAWLKKNVLEPDRRFSYTIALGFPAIFVAGLSFPSGWANGAVLVLGVAWLHFAVSLPVCAATILAFGARACRMGRELQGQVFGIATIAGAASPFIAPVLIYVCFEILDSALPAIFPLGGGGVIRESIISFAWVAGVAIPLLLQVAASFMALPRAGKAFVRAYPWSEETEVAEPRPSIEKPPRTTEPLRWN